MHIFGSPWLLCSRYVVSDPNYRFYYNSSRSFRFAGQRNFHFYEWNGWKFMHDWNSDWKFTSFNRLIGSRYKYMWRIWDSLGHMWVFAHLNQTFLPFCHSFSWNDQNGRPYTWSQEHVYDLSYHKWKIIARI